MTIDPFNNLLLLLQKLEQQGIDYKIAHHRDESIMVTVAIPGERWEIEFLNDRSIEIEKFVSNGEILSEEALKDLFRRYQEDNRGIAESGIIVAAADELSSESMIFS